MGCEDPANKTMPCEWLMKENRPMMMCRVCQSTLLKLTPQRAGTEVTRDNPTGCDMRITEYAGRRHAFCSTWCERMFLTEPERYTGQNFFEIFDGWELSDIVRATGGVRSDGKTLVSQPHLRSERLWTLDDLAACRIHIRDPLVAGVSFEKH